MKLEERLSNVELLLLDVDGILTDGRIMIDNNGVETKAFDVTDGHGLKMLQRAGVEVGIITGRRSDVVDHRALELGIEEVNQGARDKLQVLRRIIAKRTISPERIAYMGDDVVDLPVLLQVGLSITVPEAAEAIREKVDMVTLHSGGSGAVREVCEKIIKAKGLWEELTDRYFNPEKL